MKRNAGTNQTTGDDHKKSTWREQTVTVAPGDITTVYFDDTKPNHSAITNNTSQIVYVHERPSVSPTNYLIAVAPGSTKLLARPLGYHTIYLDAAVTQPEKVRSNLGLRNLQRHQSRSRLTLFN